jgi:hypothetical protein
LHHAPVLAPHEEARALENGEVLHESWQRHRGSLRERADWRRTAGELLHDRASRGIGQGGKDAIEDGGRWSGPAGRGLIVNHMV